MGQYQIGMKEETTYGTAVVVDRFIEVLPSPQFRYDPEVYTSPAMRAGGKLPRSNRRAIVKHKATASFETELFSKGLGVLLEGCMGAGASTLVAGSTYQQNFTLADTMKSYTIQAGVPRGDDTVVAKTLLGGKVSGFELTFGQDVGKLKVNVDGRTIDKTIAKATASYASGGELFHFENATIYSGTLTAPTTTGLASATAALAYVRSGSLSVTHKMSTGSGWHIGGAGLKTAPKVWGSDISGQLELDYVDEVFIDALYAETAKALVLTYTAEALSTGTATFQVVIPEIKIDPFDLPTSDGGSEMPGLTVPFTVLDNLTATQPIWLVTRTSDTAL